MNINNQFFFVLFKDDDDEWNETAGVTTTCVSTDMFVGKCVAQYDFAASRDDELTLAFGDAVNILEKRDDGWWRGELRSTIGLFPSSYVKEIA